MSHKNQNLAARSRQVPKFNSNVVYFVEELEYLPGNYAVIGYNTDEKVVYLTLFEGKDSKERAIEYRNFKNGAQKQLSESIKADNNSYNSVFSGNTLSRTDRNECGTGEDPGDCTNNDSRSKFGYYGNREYGC